MIERVGGWRSSWATEPRSGEPRMADRGPGWVGSFRATEPRIERWVVRSQTNCSNLHSLGNDDKLRKYQDVSLKP